MAEQALFPGNRYAAKHERSAFHQPVYIIPRAHTDVPAQKIAPMRELHVFPRAVRRHQRGGTKLPLVERRVIRPRKAVGQSRHVRPQNFLPAEGLRHLHRAQALPVERFHGPAFFHALHGVGHIRGNHAAAGLARRVQRGAEQRLTREGARRVVNRNPFHRFRHHLQPGKHGFLPRFAPSHHAFHQRASAFALRERAVSQKIVLGQNEHDAFVQPRLRNRVQAA